MRLLLDEMIGPRVAQTLRQEGLDVVAVVERTDLRSLGDEAVLEFAHEDDRVLVTRNISDFARLDRQWRAEGRPHRGLVMVTGNAFPQNRNLVGSLAAALARAAHQRELPSPGDVRYLRPPAGHPPRLPGGTAADR